MVKDLILISIIAVLLGCSNEKPCVENGTTNCAVSQNNFDAIQIGMTEAETIQLLGSKNKITLTPAFPKKWSSGYRWVRYATVGESIIAIDLFLKDGVVVKKQMINK